MRRAIADDDEIELVGLIRIAKKEPKFTFRSHRGESTNPLFRGFGNQEDEQDAVHVWSICDLGSSLKVRAG